VILIYRSFVSRGNACTCIYNLCVTWSPFDKCDIDSVEKEPRRFTKWLAGLRNLTYGQRPETAGLTTMELRRLHADLAMCDKIVLGLSWFNLPYHC